MAYVKSSKIAARIGVTPATLKTWRSRGEGPACWIHLGPTLVVYDEDGIEEWLAARRAEAVKQREAVLARRGGAA